MMPGRKMQNEQGLAAADKWHPNRLRQIKKHLQLGSECMDAARQGNDVPQPSLLKQTSPAPGKEIEEAETKAVVASGSCPHSCTATDPGTL